MPIYAYRCLKCESESEYIQKMSDDPLTVCEACGGQLVRQVTAAAFHLKGGGWYKDGYASTKPGDGGGDKGGESTSAPASDSGSKSESSKPAESTTSAAKAAAS